MKFFVLLTFIVVVQAESGAQMRGGGTLQKFPPSPPHSCNHDEVFGVEFLIVLIPFRAFSKTSLFCSVLMFLSFKRTSSHHQHKNVTNRFA